MGMISLRVSQEEEAVMKGYAESRGMSLSQLMRESILGLIEDEYDIKAYSEYLAYKDSCKMLSFDEAKELWK